MLIWPTLALLLIAGAVGAVAAPAEAATRTVARSAFVPLAGPALAGDRVVWSVGRARGGFQVLTRPVSGGARRAQWIRPPAPGYEWRPTLAASSQRVLVQGTNGSRFQVFGGPVGGSLRPLAAECEAYQQTVRSLDVAGTRSAYRGPPCSRNEAEAVVSDDASTPPTRARLADGALGMRVAGRFVAYTIPPPAHDMERLRDIVVHDVEAGAELYRVPGRSVPAGLLKGGFAGSYPSLDVREDGAVAFVFLVFRGGAWRSRVAWSSPRDRRVRVLPLPQAGHYAVRFAGSRLLVLRAPRFSTGGVTGATLELRDLRGRLRRVVATGVDDHFLHERFDADPRRVTYVRRSCAGATVHVRSLSEPRPARWRSPSRCRLRLIGRPQIDLEDGTVEFLTTCRGLPRDCLVAGAKATVTERVRGRRRTREIGEGYTSEPGARFPSILIELYPEAVRRLRRHRRLRTTITARMGDQSFVAAGDVGAIQRRTATVTLHAP
jgi:hypothetical protein